ncbi:MAG TPA: cytochrome b/b6 domain-containing protein [Rheinheimera sp.]|nr:cytochrome b/b6 domain-containing protein [Rheinheimera sp.]
MSQKVQVWDFAVRFFHWSQLLLLIGLWYTGEEGMMAQHQLLAYSLLALIIARFYWGVFGNKAARFSAFSAKPLAALRYLKRPVAVNGHNPASFYMIMLLLTLLLLQLLTGMATFDNSYISDGPLVSVLPSSWVDIASDWHKLNFDLLVIALLVHIVAAIWHSIRVHNVIGTMLTGKDTAFDKPELLRSSWPYFVVVAVVMFGLYFWQGHKLVALL